jgi:CHAT domain-containing protein
MAPLLGVIAILALQRVSVAPQDPRSVLVQATRAIEGDSAAAVARVWSTRLVRHPDDWGAALGLATLARLRYVYDTADSGFSRLIRDAGAAGPRAVAYVAGARLELGQGLQMRGLSAGADSAYAEAAANARQAGDLGLQAEALIALAGVRARTHGPQAGDSLLRRAATLIPRQDFLLQSEYRCSRAALLQMTGRPEVVTEARAGADLARLVQVRRQHANCLRILAASLVDRGFNDSGLVVFRDVVSELAAAHDRAALASALQWRGFLFNTDYRFGPAREDLLRAVQEGIASGAQSPHAWALLNLAQLSAWAGDLPSARQYGDSAAGLFQSQADRWGLWTLRGLQGQVAYLSGDRAAARTYIEEALAGAEATGYAPSIVTGNMGLAALDLDEGELADAERHLNRARSVARDHQLPGLDAGLTYRFSRLAVRRGHLEVAERELRRGLRAVTANQPAAAYEWRAGLADVLMRRGRVADAEAELRAANDALDSVRAAVADRELRTLVLQSLREFRDPDLGIPWVLAGLVASGRSAAAFELAERLKSRGLLDRMILRDALRQREATPLGPLDSMRHFSPHVTTGDVAAALPDSGTALLEYVTGGEGAPTTLFVVTRAGVRAMRLAPLDSLAADVRRFTTLIEAGENPRELGRALGDAVLAPALQALPAVVTHLVVVPDAGLQQLPLEALTLDGGRLVVERFSLSVVPSAGVAVHLWRRAPSTRPVDLLAFGDPRFARETDAGGEAAVYRSAFDANGGLPRLAASAAEVRAVARYADESEVRLRDQASEAYLKRSPLNRYRILHFAAHAMVDEQAPTRTALALAPGDGEDGFVTPGDLAALDLDADLVVLSACRTAEGVDVRGEGVEGLTAPLLQAGARVVLATRWRVGDREAAKFVERFYGELAAGKPTGMALTAAKRDALRSGQLPAIWAAFSLVGDPDVRIPLHVPARLWRLWVGLGVLVLLAGYGFVTRKGRTAERN